MTPSKPLSYSESESHRFPVKAPRLAVGIVLTSFAGLALFVGIASPAAARVFGAGPDDPALFDTVINLPADQPSISGSVGNASGAATPTTQLNVAEGGGVGNFFAAQSGSEVNISGGAVGDWFQANSGSEVNVSGGSLGRPFFATPGSDVDLTGGEFVLNGTPFSGSTITLSGEDVFTGTLSDGSAFVFSPLAFDALPAVTLTAATLPERVTMPQTVTTNLSGGPVGLRVGQELTLQAGGMLGDSFAVVDATMNVQDGVVGRDLEAVRSTVNISGGAVGNSLYAYSGSEVNISGGAVGHGFQAHSGSKVNISGGAVGRSFDARSGSEVNISGGTVSTNFAARSGSEVNISGGNVGSSLAALSGSIVNISGGAVGIEFGAQSGSEVNISGGAVGKPFRAHRDSGVHLVGVEFFLDGLLLDELTLGETLTIDDRDVSLSGTLADGSPFSFDLNSTNEFGLDFFDTVAVLTVTLTNPETLAGDFNDDGVVDAADYTLWRDGESPNGSQAGYDLWSNNYGSTVPGPSPAAVVPEPAACLLLLLAATSALVIGVRLRHASESNPVARAAEFVG